MEVGQKRFAFLLRQSLATQSPPSRHRNYCSVVQRLGAAERPALARLSGRAVFVPARSSGLLDGIPPRYSARMKLSIELSAAQAERLRHEAERLGLSPEDLARAVVADVLATPAEDFRVVAERVIRQNQELYRRLA